MRHLGSNIVPIILVTVAVIGCGGGKEGGECKGPAINTEALVRFKSQSLANGPTSYLIVPNPADALNDSAIALSDSRLGGAYDLYNLSGLSNPGKLENNYLKIRIKANDDPASSLATQTKNGQFAYPITNAHYSEVMAYQTLASMTSYLAALGFPLDTSRPLFVLTRIPIQNIEETNAYFDNSNLDLSAPTSMKLFGESTGQDRDMYWHEIGHGLAERTRALIDYAGDNGAPITQGSSLHECFADYLEQSVSGTDYIGRYIARNFSDIPKGEPLRWASDRNDGKSDYAKVTTNDGKSTFPKRYDVAEWCTRVMHDVRSRFVQKYGEVEGPILADRLVFGAMELLKKDTSIREFYSALGQTDQKYYCGENGADIQDAFAKRGFPLSTGRLVNKLQIQSTPVVVAEGLVGFKLSIRNPNSEIARNVRVRLEAKNAVLIPITYLQAYGDVSPNTQFEVGGAFMDEYYMVTATADQARLGNATSVPYRLVIFAENGGENVLEGEIR